MHPLVLRRGSHVNVVHAENQVGHDEAKRLDIPMGGETVQRSDGVSSFIVPVYTLFLAPYIYSIYKAEKEVETPSIIPLYFYILKIIIV